MVIDFHTHIFPDAIAKKSLTVLSERSDLIPSTDGTLQGLLDSMERSGVDCSVILPVVTKPSQFHSVNRFAAEVNAQYKGRLISFGGIHPDSEDYKKELEEIKAWGLPGIKLHPDYQGVAISDPRYKKIIAYADELDLIIVTHAGIDIGLPQPVHCTPQGIRQVIDEIRPKRFVAAHIGGWKMWEDVYRYLAGQNIYFDTAFSMPYIEEETFLKIWQNHDRDKILFATDLPWGEQKKDIESVRRLPIKEEEKEAILFENARRVLYNN